MNFKRLRTEIMYRDGSAPFKLSQLLRQLKSDWFGKEVQSGYTYTYVWMANQFANFNLGFLPSFFIISLDLYFYKFTDWLFLVPVLQLFLWMFKEFAHYLQTTKNHGLAFQRSGSSWQKKYRHEYKMDIFMDSITSLLFFFFGLVTAFSMVFSWVYPLLFFAIFFLIAFIPSYYWLSRKLCFQQADLPFQYRIWNFDRVISNEEAHHIVQFIKGRNKIKHLLIFGPPRSQKTSLAVGIGTERTFHVRPARYATFPMFLKIASYAEKPEHLKYEGKVYWPWRMSELLIIDDVTPSSEEENLITIDEVTAAIKKLPQESLEELQNLQTVWVLGYDTRLKKWVSTIQKLMQCSATEIATVQIHNEATPKLPKK